jgi:predicted transcriptional regulator
MEHVAVKRPDFDGILKLISRIRNDLDALQEELEIISDKEFAEKIEEGLTDIEEGRVYGLEEFERALKNKGK